MKLRLEYPYYSIVNFPEIELPALTLVHGVNGAGKSHMLRAMTEGGLFAFDGERQLNSVYASDFSENNPFAYIHKHSNKNDSDIFQNFENYITNGEPTQKFLQKNASANEINSFNNRRQLVEAIIRRCQKDNPQEIHDLNNDIIDEIKILSGVGDTLSKKLDNYCKYTGNTFLDFTVEEYASDDWGVINSPFLSPPIGTLLQRYRRAWVSHQKLKTRAAVEGRSSPTDEDFLARHGESPWSIYNKRLKDLGIDFEIKDPPEDYSTPWHISIKKNGKDVHMENISSGEKVILNLAMSTLAKEDNSFKIYRPDILLLDEPDAHLHPGLVSKMFADVINPLIKEGTRVIITTHSPTTVAQAPKDSIYEKVMDGGLQQTSKQSAIDRLLVDVPHIAINPTGRRQVFTESSNDAIVYQAIYDRIRDEIVNERSLTFIAVGDGIGGGKDQVCKFVANLRNNGNNSIFGIIDWDGKNNSSDYIIVNSPNDFYSIENCILNPLTIGCMLMTRNYEPLSDFNYVDVRQYTPEKLQEIANIIENKIGIPPDDSKNIVKLMNGHSIYISKKLMEMNGHDYEELIISKIHKLNALKNESNGLLKSSIHGAIRNIPEILPQSLLNLFLELLS